MLPVTDALSNLAQTVLTRLNRDLGKCLLTLDATCVERSPTSNGRRGKTTLKKKYRALLGRYRRHKRRYRSKVDECLEIAVRNAALQSEVDALTVRNATLQSEVDALTVRNATLQSEVDALTVSNAALQSEVDALTVSNAALQSEVDALTTKLSKSRTVFAPPPLVVRCRLY
jgi:FtsZ-binding cell division protein ZapB